jgi:hypothetical protein
MMVPTTSLGGAAVVGGGGGGGAVVGGGGVVVLVIGLVVGGFGDGSREGAVKISATTPATAVMRAAIPVKTPGREVQKEC